MSASAETASYPTAEQIEPDANTQFHRLTWLFRQPLETAITVLDDAADPQGPSQPYYQPSQDGGGGFDLHEISQQPVTTPPVSSINVECEEWDAWHCMMGLDYDAGEEPPYDEDGYPPPSPQLLVTASPERGYVTIHDYVTQVWPWIFEHRYMILKSLDPVQVELSMETEWVIDTRCVGSMVFIEKET